MLPNEFIMQPERKTYRKICAQCGKEFLAYTSTTACCSDRCAKLLDKHRKRDERLHHTTIEVRETQRLALLDKNYLTLSDAARLMQISRNTLYKIIRAYNIPLMRYTGRTVRISREDLEKAGLANVNLITATTATTDEILSSWMTREQVMEKYQVTHSWFYSTIKKHKPTVKVIGCKAFYDKDEMERIFSSQDYSYIKEWYTFDQLRSDTGMRTESICDYCSAHKIPRRRKNGITYVSKKHWDESRGNTIDPKKYISMQEIMETYRLSRTHLQSIFKETGPQKIKKGNFVYFQREEISKILKYRLSKIQAEL